MRLELVCKSLGLKNRILRGLLDHWGLLVVEVCENCCTWDVVNLCWLMGWSPKALGLLMNVQNLWLSFSVFLLLRDENILSLRKRLDRLLSKCRGWLRCHLGVVSYVFCVRETWLSWLFVWNWLTIILFLLFFFWLLMIKIPVYMIFIDDEIFRSIKKTLLFYPSLWSALSIFLLFTGYIYILFSHCIRLSWIYFLNYLFLNNNNFEEEVVFRPFFLFIDSPVDFEIFFWSSEGGKKWLFIRLLCCVFAFFILFYFILFSWLHCFIVAFEKNIKYV